MRLALDTNVLVSAAIADGPPRRVLELVIDGRAELILPRDALTELGRVLTEKLGFSSADAEDVTTLLEQLSSRVVETPPDVAALSGDPDDDRIVAAAVGAGADVLVSGDRRHVLPLGRVGAMRIVRPQDLLAELSR